ncbi:MAG TPA: hypothetical protein VH063_07575 [Gaiellaceae bacterium]|nr:hypothetical protein [Gaiellaceae bacterium]
MRSPEHPCRSPRRGHAFAALGIVALVAVGTAAAALPLAPLSSVGRLTPAPSPGPLGPEGVPVPKAPIFANVPIVKKGQTIDGVTCDATEKIAFHIHAHLTLFVSGHAFQIPYGIGIGPPVEGVNTTAGPFATSGSCFMWLHTHALDGIIHIEAPKLQRFKLGQFFAIWGVKLSKRQLGSRTGKVTAFYNGKVWTADPADIPLTSEAQIQLDLGKPLIAPQHIKFPKGLAASMTKTK